MGQKNKSVFCELYRCVIYQPVFFPDTFLWANTCVYTHFTMKRASYGSLQRRRILEAIEVVVANFYPVYRSTPPLPSPLRARGRLYTGYQL